MEELVSLAIEGVFAERWVFLWSSPGVEKPWGGEEFEKGGNDEDIFEKNS